MKLFRRAVLPVVLIAAFGAPASHAVASPFEAIVTVQGGTNGIGGNNATGTAFAQCPGGTQLVGGGGFWSRSTTNMAIVRSVPAIGANGWEITGRNWSGTGRSLTATAQCGLPKPGGGFASTFTQTSSGSVVGAGGFDLESVGCPQGTQMLSGGGFWENLNRSQLGFVENDARGSEWAVTGRNWSSVNSKVFAVALCGVPGANGGFGGFFDVFGGTPGFPQGVAPGQAGWSEGRTALCGPDAEPISTGGFWNAQAGDLSRSGGLALTAFGGESGGAHFFAEGGNMSNRTFELVARARCGT